MDLFVMWKLQKKEPVPHRFKALGNWLRYRMMVNIDEDMVSIPDYSSDFIRCYLLLKSVQSPKKLF